MAENLASFGGIIRIRFKGSVAAATLSAHGSPALTFSGRIELAPGKSISSKSGKNLFALLTRHM